MFLRKSVCLMRCKLGRRAVPRSELDSGRVLDYSIDLHSASYDMQSVGKDGVL
jgi:hypothetical protein